MRHTSARPCAARTCVRRRHKTSFLLQDHGTPPLSSVSYVIINVVDRDDMNPIFTKSVYRASIKENYPITVSQERRQDGRISFCGGWN